MEAPTFKDASLKSSLIFLDKPFVSPFVTHVSHVSSIKHLNVNIIKEKKNKDPKTLTGLSGGSTRFDEGGYIPLSTCIKEASRLGTSSGNCSSYWELRVYTRSDLLKVGYSLILVLLEDYTNKFL